MKSWTTVRAKGFLELSISKPTPREKSRHTSDLTPTGFAATQGLRSTVERV